MADGASLAALLVASWVNTQAGIGDPALNEAQAYADWADTLLVTTCHGFAPLQSPGAQALKVGLEVANAAGKAGTRQDSANARALAFVDWFNAATTTAPHFISLTFSPGTLASGFADAFAAGQGATGAVAAAAIGAALYTAVTGATVASEHGPGGIS